MARKKSDGPIATKLRARIKTCNFSYSYLAEQSKVSQSAISKFVAGQDITLSTAEKLLEVLDQGYVGATRAANELERLLVDQHQRTVKEMREYIELYGELGSVEKSLQTLTNFVDKIRRSMEEN